MTTYIIDVQKFEVVKPDNRYRVFHDEDALFDYWNLAMEESGVFHEGLGYSENAKADMFNDWVKN